VPAHALVTFKDDPVLRHHRLVVRMCSPELAGCEVVVVTPDRDVQPTTLEVGDVFSEVIKWNGKKLPAGIKSGDCYLDKHSESGVFTEEDVLRFQGVAARIAGPSQVQHRLQGRTTEAALRALIQVAASSNSGAALPAGVVAQLGAAGGASSGIVASSFSHANGPAQASPPDNGVVTGAGPPGKVNVWPKAKAGKKGKAPPGKVPPVPSPKEAEEEEEEEEEEAGRGLGPVALWRSQLDVHAGTPGPVGTVWLASEPLGGLVLGQEVTLNSVTDVIFGSHTALALRQGLWVKCELLREADAPEYSDMRKKLFGATTPLELLDSREADGEVELRNRLLGKKMPELRAEEGVSVKEESTEVRTLWVDYDAHGERHKAWREVVRESSSQVYPDFPLDGPSTCLHLIRHIERTGGDPRLWLQIWLRTKKIEETDRVAHEMKVLVDALYFGGIYDQLNLPALVCIEVVCRRLQLIVEAYANPARPSWENARLYASQASAEEVISPAFRSWAAKKNKEEAEIASARTKARDLRGGGATATEEAAAAALGGEGVLPAGRGRGFRNGRGRGLAPAPQA
jgi:hypothetical protein